MSRLPPLVALPLVVAALALLPTCRTGRGDRDEDGIANKDDACNREPEDFDGFEDEDGCPDPDNDKDGVLDVVDACANLPGPQDGCPADATSGGAAPAPSAAPSARGLDRDGDGIPDSADACSSDPEDKDGFADDDGCPDADNDGDGVPDSVDPCPNEAGANGGCP